MTDHDEGPDADDTASAETASEPGEDGGLSRRAILTGSVAATGISAGAYLLYDGDEQTGDGTGTGETPDGSERRLDPPFDVWRELQTGLRASPDHLPGTADDLVEAGDPEAIYEFVRDEVALKPPSLTGNEGFASRVDGSPAATLRAGMGAPRENAALLAALLRRADYQASVRAYDRPLSLERTRDLYFDGPSQVFDPDLDEESLQEWADLMGDNEDSPDEMALVDEDGEDSAALGERVREGLPDDADAVAREFGHGLESESVPVVRFRSAETDSWQYADLFHADESFGEISDRSKLDDPPDTETDPVSVTLEAARMDAPEERFELVSGIWEAPALAGRQLGIDTLPGKSMLDHPMLRFDDVGTYVPALALRDPSTETSVREELSVVGEPFTLTGERYTVDDTGTLRRGGVVMDEGEQEWDLIVETPDGERQTITPIESDQPVEDYYDYDNDQPVSADFPDDIERTRETVLFFYRNTNSGRLSLVVVHDHPEESDGGSARMIFDATQLYEWKVQDGIPDESPDKDVYEAAADGSSPTLSATWAWVSGRTDGGAIGTLTPPFEFEITHDAEWEERNDETERSGLDRWVFLDGSPDEVIELAGFDEDTGDVTLSLYTELVSETDPERPDVGDVETFDAAVSAGNFPEIRVGLDPRDADGNPVEEVPGDAVAVLEDDELVGAEFVPGEDPDVPTLSYRTPNRDEADDSRSVTVEIDGVGRETVDYEVPQEPTDPRTERGLSGLYLELEVGDRTVERTLAGWDPELDADRDPDESDHDEVFSVLWGGYTLAFETGGVPTTVALEEEIAGNLTLEPVAEARRSNDVEAMREAAREGHGLVSQLPYLLHPRLPDRTTEESLTYGVGLRTTLTGIYPVFGEGVEKRTVDALSTASIRTLRSDDDRAREFAQTMDRTARRSVLEGAGFGTSTASELEGTTLVRAGVASDAMDDDVRRRLEIATARRDVAEADYRLTAESGETASFWHVDGDSGAVLGVLPDGSGGGEGEGVIRLLEKIHEAIRFAEEMSPPTGPPSPPDATDAVAHGYNYYLSRLYAVAATSVATMSSEEFSEGVKNAIAKRVCNISRTLAEVRPVPNNAVSDMAEFMYNVQDSKEHSARECMQNEYTE